METNFENISEVVDQVIKKVAAMDEVVALDTRLTDLRINSVKIIQIIAGLEDKLDFELDEEDLVMSNFSTPRMIISLLCDKYFQVIKE